MATVETIEIQGMKPLIQYIERLPAHLRTNVLQASLRKSGRVLVEEIKARVPVSRKGSATQDWFNRYSILPGRLRNAVTEKKDTEVDIDTIGSYVYVKKGKSRDDDKGAWYAHFIEFGHRIVIPVRQKGGNYTTKEIGHYPARGFMRGGFDHENRNIVRASVRDLRRGLEKHKVTTNFYDS